MLLECGLYRREGNAIQNELDLQDPTVANYSERMDAFHTLPGQETLLRAWEALSSLSSGARMVHSPATVAAVFPSWTPLNNAILLDGKGTGTDEIPRLAQLYRDAGVDAWAVWRPSQAIDFDAADQIHEMGSLVRDTTTLVMQAMIREEFQSNKKVVRTSIASATLATDEPVPVSDLGEPDGIDSLAGWVLVEDGFAVVGAWSFRNGDDCGLYTVGTVPDFQRRGLARALLEHVLADARASGARTASLQSTRMGQHLYESLGFEAVGRYEEWATDETE